MMGSRARQRHSPMLRWRCFRPRARSEIRRLLLPRRRTVTSWESGGVKSQSPFSSPTPTAVHSSMREAMVSYYSNDQDQLTEA